MRCVRVWVSETKRVVKSDERKDMEREARKKRKNIECIERKRERENQERKVKCDVIIGIK